MKRGSGRRMEQENSASSLSLPYAIHEFALEQIKASQQALNHIKLS